MNQLHPIVYVSCAVIGTAAIAMLIVSDAENIHDLGKWGLLTALVSAVLAFVIICDRFTRRICTSAHQEAEALVDEVEGMLKLHTGAVVGAYGDQTTEIAEAVCRAVVEGMYRGPRPTPIKR